MHLLLRALDRYLNALARTPGEEFAYGLHTYRLIEHPRDVRPARRPETLGKEERILERAS